MKCKSSCVVPRCHKNGEQSENYFSKCQSLKRMRIPTEEYLPTFEDKGRVFFPPPLILNLENTIQGSFFCSARMFASIPCSFSKRAVYGFFLITISLLDAKISHLVFAFLNAVVHIFPSPLQPTP